jgi:DNA primase catalytic core
MARIPEAEIERLKREISLERLAEARGVKLQRHGKDLVGLCPFHEDRNPSLVITPEKNIWHCLGACQAGGSVIDWVMRAKGVSFRHAVELLREEHPSLVADAPAPSGGRKRYTTAPRIAGEIAPSAEDEALLVSVVGYYQATLKESPEALEYLAKRGLRSAEMVERFRLGFANRSLAYRIPAKHGRGSELRERLQGLGVLRESGHEHFNGSIVIPIFDEEGRVTEMYGRKINDHLRKGTPMHLYLPGPHRGVWNWEAFRASKEIILCESLIDALTFWCAGFRNVTASYGVEGFTADHREMFRGYGVERVLVAYDRDEAGDRAAEKLASELTAMGAEVFRVRFPKGMDANEYALKVGPAERSLGLALRQSEWMAGVRKGGEVGREVATVMHDADEPAPMETKAAPTSTPATNDLSATESAPTRETEAPSAMPIPLESSSEPVEASATVSMPPLAANEEPLPYLAAERVTPPAVPTRANAAHPSANPPARAMEVKADEVVMVFGDRRWRVRGLSAKASSGSLRVNVLVSREGGAFHVDTLELYSARQRAQYTTLAGGELGVEERVIKRDLGEVLLRLEELVDQRGRESEQADKRRELSDAEKSVALELLRDPKLLERILRDFERCGVVGEETNKLVGYLAATSRKLEEPLAIVIQSSSAAGKSSLMDAVLALMPEEERVQYSAMTGQSLFYMGETNLSHKILAIVEEEGAERATYALKLLQSEGELTIASTGKDPTTGRLVTQEYRVEGPVMIFLTTTAVDIDEELLNRCLVLTVDEGREQTRAIHERQRHGQTLQGLLGRAERQRVMKVHQDAQRLLRPLLVANPHAGELRFVDTRTRTRRDFPKYLTLIRAIALLHQYQREVKEVEHGGRRVRYIEVTKEDMAIAHRLSAEVMGRTVDELPPGTRRLLGMIEALVTAGCERLGMDRADFRFSRRELREETAWGDTQLKVHLGRLVELEYLVVHRAAHSQRHVYEMAYAGEDGAAVSAERGESEREYDKSRSGFSANRSGSGRTPVGGAVRPDLRSDSGSVSEPVGANVNAHSGTRVNGASYSPSARPRSVVRATARA